LVEGAIEAIRSQIVRGDLVAGDRLPPERTLVGQLGVSRTVLREALSSLEALGLIETSTTRGRFVAAGGSSERSRTIVSAWLHHHAREILEIDEIRGALEAQAICSMSQWDAIDAAHRGAELLREQTEAVERSDAVGAAEKDAAFHRLLCSYTQNQALRVFVDGFIDSSLRGGYAVYSLPETARRSLEQHKSIIDALADSDVARAAECAREHMIDVARRHVAALRDASETGS
jgi:GntR family transcriptional regulator, transcriptional repressor for pyruvate dehydrogenase complex